MAIILDLMHILQLHYHQIKYPYSIMCHQEALQVIKIVKNYKPMRHIEQSVFLFVAHY